jgi:PilZ domain-containing protein
MKLVANPKPPTHEEAPVVEATPISVRRGEGPRAIRASARSTVSSSEAAAISFLRHMRVLTGAARLYQRNHPRLMELLTTAEQQLRVALGAHSPLVFAVERNGILLPRPDAPTGELLSDQRGELRALAEELLHSGICSLLFTPQINIGELDSFAHQISLVPRSGTPGDTASRGSWDNWLHQQRIAGIRLNVPTERRDSLLLAGLVSAVLAHDDAPQRSPHSRAATAFPAANFEQMAAALRLLMKLRPPPDPETQVAAEDIARRIHSVLSSSERSTVALVVFGIARVKPREGDTLEPYLKRLAQALILAFVRQEFEAGRVSPPELSGLLARLDQERSEAAKTPGNNSGGTEFDEARVAALCDKFWNAIPAREKAKTLRSRYAWCVPTSVVAKFLEPLATAAEKKPAAGAGREARAVLTAYARCLHSTESKERRSAASGLAELAPLIERLWPHSSASEFSQGIVQALLQETSPGIAGILSAVVEHLTRVALKKQDYAEFERMLESLESSPSDDAHAHIPTLVGRVLNDERWLYLVDEALLNRPLDPVIPRLLQRCPDRLLDRLSLLLTAPQGKDLLPAMVRLVHAAGEPVMGEIEKRLHGPRGQRIATAVHLLASADPKRLATALPRTLPNWEWSLQDLAVSELARWTNPPVVAASGQAFLATVAQAHWLVVPCMIDHLGFAGDASAVPVLLKMAAGEYPALREMYIRIKAVEALGRMRVADAAPLLRRMVRERSGLTHTEPAALRSAAEESLELIENRSSSTRLRTTEMGLTKTGKEYARPRRYPRAHPPTPFPGSITGAHAGNVRVRTISLGGAFLESEQRIYSGESLRLEIRTGLRRIQSTAVVRNVSPQGVGVEFVHMKPEDRERLRHLMKQLLS